VKRLAALLPLARLIALIDQTTDRDAVQTARSSGRRISPQSSSLRSDPDPASRYGWDPSDNVGRLIRRRPGGCGWPGRNCRLGRD